VEDGALPPAGDGFAYLIQGADDVCGRGTLGYESGGDERLNLDPQSCF